MSISRDLRYMGYRQMERKAEIAVNSKVEAVWGKPLGWGLLVVLQTTASVEWRQYFRGANRENLLWESIAYNPETDGLLLSWLKQCEEWSIHLGLSVGETAYEFVTPLEAVELMITQE